MDVRINNIIYNRSLIDGPGIRSLIFFQGCDMKCKGCHNKQTWDISKGIGLSVTDLSNQIRKNSFNKKITITGGEPLLQIDSLMILVKELKDFDICLYTGRELKDVPTELLEYINYIKVGPYIEEQKCSTTPYIGSSNQQFLKVEDIK